ncbi:hypothetical protein ElyMa_002212600 [Elysia marginata]|uniref:Uncharacterized protein n=1 Tax=Elysia marginata TaxID=1093978 RepID=A0AAV4FTV1_9GAST|nr:hypothetical protein ElyMa_002212600 [Elysia marginata]
MHSVFKERGSGLWIWVGTRQPCQRTNNRRHAVNPHAANILRAVRIHPRNGNKYSNSNAAEYKTHLLIKLAAMNMIRRWFFSHCITVAIFVSVAGLDKDRAQYVRGLRLSDDN